MLRIETVINGTRYYWSEEPQDYLGQYYEPRIVDPFEISRVLNDIEKSGIQRRTISVTLDNRDGLLNQLEADYGLINQTFEFYLDTATTNPTKVLFGKVQSIDGMGLSCELTISESANLYLDQNIPDAQIAANYYSDNGSISDSWAAVPIIFGRVPRMPVICPTKLLGQFIIGAGELYSIDKIYLDQTLMYNSDPAAPLNFYKAQPTDNGIKVRIYKGSGYDTADHSLLEVVDGRPSMWPGFAYLEFYDAVTNSLYDINSNPIVPVMTDGTVPTIYVDVQGCINDARTGPERNPAIIMKKLLTNPQTSQMGNVFTPGANGWGLNYDPAKLDFAQAITDCNTTGYVIDGVIDNIQTADQWFTEIGKCCAGQLTEVNGLLTLKIDKAKTTVQANFDETGETGYNTILGPWKEPAVDQQFNRMRLSYDKCMETGQFLKKPADNQESPCGATNLCNTAHATRIGQWNTKTMELPLVKDDVSAHKVTQIFFNRSILQLRTIEFISEKEVPDTLDVDALITLTAARYGWTNKYFIIQNISKSKKDVKITAREYDASVYTYTGPGVHSDPAAAPINTPYAVPAKPTGVTVTSVATLQADGTTQVVLTLGATPALTNSSDIVFYRKLQGDPVSSFAPFAVAPNGHTTFIWHDAIGGYWNIRAVTRSPFNVYSDITITAGDTHYLGQPGVESAIQIQGDLLAPGTPVISSITPVVHGIAFAISITGGTPTDFNHFEVKRKIDGGAEVVINVNATTMLYVDTDVALDYKSIQYAVRAIDNTNNASAWTSYTTGAVPLQVGTNDISPNSVTSNLISGCQIIGKDFRTATNAGNANGGAYYAGVKFNSSGVEGWSTTGRNFFLDATTGMITACNASISGTITATTGMIGGICVCTGAIQSVGFCAATCTGFQIACDGSANFQNITARGTVYAVVGAISGWTLATGYLKNAGDTVGLAPADYPFYAGCNYANRASAPFRVDTSGNVTANAGTIAGWTINASYLSSANVGMSPSDYPFYAGCDYAHRATALFRVDTSGNMFATSGKLGSWCLCSNNLFPTDSNAMIKSAQCAGAGGNGIVIDCDSIRGYSCTLGGGMTFCLPANGTAPMFSSGCIKCTTWVVDTSSILQTAVSALCCCAGVLINNSGIYTSSSTTNGTANALTRILATGDIILGGTCPQLIWCAATCLLTVCGTICSGAGHIGLWNLTSDGLVASGTCTGYADGQTRCYDFSMIPRMFCLANCATVCTTCSICRKLILSGTGLVYQPIISTSIIDYNSTGGWRRSGFMCLLELKDAGTCLTVMELAWNTANGCGYGELGCISCYASDWTLYFNGRANSSAVYACPTTLCYYNVSRISTCSTADVGIIACSTVNWGIGAYAPASWSVVGCGYCGIYGCGGSGNGGYFDAASGYALYSNRGACITGCICATNRIFAGEWIQMATEAGLYWGASGACFCHASYYHVLRGPSAWGAVGIQFQTGTSAITGGYLYADSTAVGFLRASDESWQIRASSTDICFYSPICASSSIITPDYIYSNWHHICNGSGIYQTDGHYFYPDTIGWVIRGSHTTVSALRMETIDGNEYGCFLANTSCDIGIVGNTGGWLLKASSNAACWGLFNSTKTGNYGMLISVGGGCALEGDAIGGNCGVIGCSGCCIGVYGRAACNYAGYFYAYGDRGVFGQAATNGVFGCATSAYGVDGQSAGNYGGYFYAAGCIGVYGVAGACGVVGTSGGNYGGYFTTAACFGVYSCAATCLAVYAYATNCAGYFGVAAAGCVGICTNGIVWAAAHCVSSSRSIKTNITPLRESVIPRIRNLEISAWQWRDNPGQWNFGTFAEDFQREFPWWGDGRGLPELGGLALRGIQELTDIVSDQYKCIAKLNDSVVSYESRIKALELKAGIDSAVAVN